MNSCVRRFYACAAIALTLVFAASPAAASTETLKRSLSNILFAPVDIVLSPIVAAHTIYHNLYDIGRFITGYSHLIGINYDDVIASINVWRVFCFMLTAQTTCDLSG